MKKRFLATLLLILATVLLTVGANAAETDNVAKVGETGYATLAAAVDAAEAANASFDEYGDLPEAATVVLLTDLTISETIKIEDPIKVDLGGHTLTCTAKKAFEVYADAIFVGGTMGTENTVGKIVNTHASGRCIDTRTNVTLKVEGIVLQTTGASNPQPLTIGGYDNGTTVTVYDTTIDAGKAGYGIISFVKTGLRIEQSSVTGYAALYMKAGSANSDISVNGSALIGKNESSYHESNSFATIVLEDDNISLQAWNGSSIVAEDKNGSGQVLLNLSTESGDGVTGVEVCFFDNVTLTKTGAAAGYLSAASLSGNTVVIPADYVDEFEAEGYIVDGGVIIGYNAPINTEAALKDAIANAENGDTITLAANVTVSTAISVTKNLTIDLNGKTLTNAVVQARLFNVDDGCTKFTLDGTKVNSRIVHDPEMEHATRNFGIIRINAENAEITVNGGTYDCDTLTAVLFRTHAPNTTFTFTNAIVETDAKILTCADSGSIASATFTDCSFTSTDNGEKGGGLSLSANGPVEFDTVTVSVAIGPAVEIGGKNATATFTDCIFATTSEPFASAPGAAVAVSFGATVDIVSGTYTGSDSDPTYGKNAVYIYPSGGTVNVKGGTFNGNLYAHLYDSSVYDAYYEDEAYSSVFNVTGGHIAGELVVNNTSARDYVAKHVVSGGTFNVSPAAYLADGYAVQKQENGTIKVILASDVKDLEDLEDDVTVNTTISSNQISTGASTGSSNVNTDNVASEAVDTVNNAANAIVNNIGSATIADDESDEENAIGEAAELITTQITKEEKSVAAAALEAAGAIDTSDNEADEIHIHVETSLDITVTDVAVEGTGSEVTVTSITVDITPVAKVIASTSETSYDVGTNAVVVSEKQEIEVTKPVTISIPLPAGFASAGNTVTIVHTKNNEDKTTYMYEAVVSDVSGQLVATFTNPNGFSTFTVSTKDQLTAAVETAGEDATIVLENDIALETALQITNGKKVTINLNGYNITSAYDPYTIDVNKGGELTIIGEGVIDNTSAGSTVIRNYGILTIGEEGKAGPTVTRGVTLNGAGNSAVKCEEDSVLNIYSGIFGGDERSIQSWGTTNIYGGTFKETVEAWEWTDSTKTYESELTITGGTFEDEVKVGGKDSAGVPIPADNDAEISISGGTFDTDISEYLAGGYQLNSNGTVSKTPTAYRIKVADAENGTVSTDYKTARAGRKVTVTVAADEKYIVKGLTVKTATGREIAVTDKGDGTYTFTMPGAAVTITAEFGIPFTDIDEDHKFYEAIEWVYTNGLMIGKTETTFDRASDVTRQQVWRVLARIITGEDTDGMAGAKAWAIEQGISDGSRPGEVATREEFITMMWIAFGKADADVTVLEKFSDADAISAEAKTAMAWAVEVGITEGYEDGTMRPAATTTRGAFAAVLYRYLSK